MEKFCAVKIFTHMVGALHCDTLKMEKPIEKKKVRGMY